jgi:hypothetical protein
MTKDVTELSKSCLSYLGITSSYIFDGSANSSIIIGENHNNTRISAKAGDIVFTNFYNHSKKIKELKEFIFDGSIWHETTKLYEYFMNNSR